MKQISSFIYNFIIIPVLYTGLLIAGLFNAKIKRGMRGRRRLFEELILNAASLNKTKKLLWFHSSSLGEFEQAKPIIEKLKSDTDVNILVTFFSPSGYENSRKYPYADLVSYIPFDTKSNAERFIRVVRPDLAIMMRYDIWPNLIWELKRKNTPVMIADATMKKSSKRMLPFIKSLHKALFGDITKILTVSQKDVEAFLEFDLKPEIVKAVGDTRFDRVHQRAFSAKSLNLIKPELLSGKKVFVAGSTWEADEDVILPAITKLSVYDDSLLFIIAPHEPDVIHLEKIENELHGDLSTIRFSLLNNYNNEKVIIIDSVGILLTLYTYADAAYVGGSFKQNIHNVLEAAVYGIPVLFGPKIDNSQEAQRLLGLGGAVLIRNKREAYRQMRTLFSDENKRTAMGKKSQEYVNENLGATDKIISEIYKSLN